MTTDNRPDSGRTRAGESDRSPAPARALGWLRAHELDTGGIRVHSHHARAYPEVTGYIVPTLLEYGERDLAVRLVHWLLSVQASEGFFTDPDAGTPYVFDTGQGLRGLLAAAGSVPAARDGAERAADWLCSQMVDGGVGGFGDRYSGEVPETVHLYVLPPLLRASELLGVPAYRLAAERCLNFYCAHEQFLRVDDLTHFLAYELEALIDLGRPELAVPVLERLRREQSELIDVGRKDLATPVLEALRRQQAKDGSVRGAGDAGWVCSPGLAQLAVCWYKTGRWGPADEALAWLESHQETSGGFLGSYGPGASYFPQDELAWAAKFFLDAHLLRVRSFFERHTGLFPSRVSASDGRARAILSTVRPGQRILEVGCGKGRFLKAVRKACPGTVCVGVDISPGLLGHLPEGVQGLRGSLESIPCPDDSFDVAFSVEAIEHSVNLAAAVAEMVRVARPGGWVIVIDKQQAHWGRLSCPPWERWPEVSEVSALLSRGCDDVTSEPVSYDNKPESDGLMVVWRGRKRSRSPSG